MKKENNKLPFLGKRRTSGTSRRNAYRPLEDQMEHIREVPFLPSVHSLLVLFPHIVGLFHSAPWLHRAGSQRDGTKLNYIAKHE
jgi:hypothetical protein